MNNWFTTHPISDDTYVISEYRHWEETHSYLLVGQSTALLIDTGLGVCNMADEIRKLTDKPVLAVATHIHWDHIGSHGSFDNIAVHSQEASWLEHFPLPLEAVRRDLKKNWHDFPLDFDPDSYRVFEGAAGRILFNGDVIELGGRQIEVIHTPGHSPGHMCFYERQRGWLFSGDLIYKGTLFAFYPSTDPSAFMESVRKISALDVSRLFPAHHTLDVTPALISSALSGFMSLKNEGKLFQGSGLYHFGDISIHI